jgi:hypothetical protein
LEQRHILWNNVYGKHAAKLGPTVAMAQAGLGSEFHLFGANRIELRLDVNTPATSDRAYGGGMSLAVGHIW